MSLRLILGRAGTGKTHHCLSAVRAALQAAPAGPPLILLVPEQATFQMEQALLGPGGVRGTMRAQVLSFQRLAWRTFMSAGGLARPPLSELGKQMVLRALVERRRAELRIFGPVADRPGFIAKLARTITEVRDYGLGAAELRAQYEAMAAAGQDQSALGSKIHDLALILADLAAYTAGRYTDPDDYLALLAERLPGSGLLQGAAVWVDGFSGFTPREFAVLEAVLTGAQRVEVTLCLDGREAARPRGWHRPTDLFHPTLLTHDRLLELAVYRGVPVAPPLLLDGPAPDGRAAVPPTDGPALPDAPSVPPRFAKAPALAYIEREFFAGGWVKSYLPAAGEEAATGETPPPPPAVAVVSAPDRRQEVAAAAREVLRLAREQGVRYREIAVILRQPEAYTDLIATVFAEHAIPTFIDQRRAVPHHPLVELIRSALEVLIQDWAYAPVFRYLKTDLVPVGRDEVDRLENYVLEHGIRGRRWYDDEPWAYVRRYTLEEDAAVSPGQAAHLAQINAIRQRAVAALAALHRRLGGGRGRRPRPVRELAAALFRLLADLGVRERLADWQRAAAAAGDLEAARAHAQVWAGVLDLLDQVVEGLGETELRLPEFLQVLAAGLDGLRLGLIPPGLDQVVVGTVERSRHSGLRATLILGATDRDFPPTPAEDAVFNDDDRERLQAVGVELAPTSRWRLFQEQYFTYLALTRGSERLWLSYPTADDEGRAMAPSPVVRRLLRLVPGAERVALAGAQPGQAAGVAAVATPRQLAAALVQSLRLARAGYPIEPVWLDLYQWVATEPALRAVAAPVLAALDYEGAFRRRTAPLGEGLARALQGERLVASVSRLESFAACPFQHFAAHGLRLREREAFRLEAPQLGLFYHAAMSLFVRRLAAAGRRWDDLAPADAAVLMDTVVDELAPRLRSEILLSSPQYRYMLRVLRRTLQASLRYLGEHIYRGQFRPLRVELPFGFADPGGGDGAGGGVASGPPGPDAPGGSLGPGGGLPPVTLALPGGGDLDLRGRIDRVDGLQAPDGTWYLRVLDYKSSARSLDLIAFHHGLSLQLLLYLYAVVRHAADLVGGPARPAGALYYPVHDPIEPLPGPLPPAEVARLRQKRYRTGGLLLNDQQVVRWMDGQAAGYSDLIPVRVNQDGSLSRSSRVADAAQFGQLFAYLERLLGRLAGGIRAGEVAVAPYRLGNRTPCTLCNLRPVCQFDPLVPGQGYRRLQRLDGAAVWSCIAGELAAAAEGGPAAPATGADPATRSDCTGGDTYG